MSFLSFKPMSICVKARGNWPTTKPLKLVIVHMRTHRRYTGNRKAVLHYGDSIDLLRTLPNESVHLTITSPPYCMGKEYEGTNKIEDFIKAHRRILPEIHRVTAPGGSICWQVGYHVKDGSVMPLDFLVHDIMQTLPDLSLRNRIIWT